MSLIDAFIEHFNKIAGAILFLSFGGYITSRIYRKNRLAEASLNFRKKVLEAVGIWYKNVYWNDDIDTQIFMATQDIETAVAEYILILNCLRKRALRKDWETAKTYCQNIRYANYLKYVENPSGKDDPKVKFNEHIDKLLSHARYK